MIQGFEYLTPGTAAERPTPGALVGRWRPIRTVLGLAAMLGLILAAGAFAQEAQQQQQQEPVLGNTGSIPAAEPAPTDTTEPAPVAVEGQIVEQEPDTFVASDLLGQWISSMDGEALGEVDDLLITADDRIAGVIVDVGGFLGFGAKPVAIQLDRLIMTESPSGERQLILDATREDLEQAPEFVSLEAKREAEEAAAALQAARQQTPGQLEPPRPADGSATAVPPTQ